MTPEDRSRIKQRIQTMITELRDTIETLEQGAKPVSLDQPIGRLSRMDSMANQAISGRVLAESRVRLRKLEWALSHVENEDFGICAGCGEDIPVARLLAMPEATLCVHCAE